MNTTKLSVALIGTALLTTSYTATAHADTCQEDEACWDAATMGNGKGLSQDGQWWHTGPGSLPIYTGAGAGPYDYSGPDEPASSWYAEIADEVIVPETSVSSARTSVSVASLDLGYSYTVAQHQAITDLLSWLPAMGYPTDLDRASDLVDLWMVDLLTLAEVYLACTP